MTVERTPELLAAALKSCCDDGGDTSGLIDAMTREYGVELARAAYNLFCSRLPGLDADRRAELYASADVYKQVGSDVSRWFGGSWRFYCTLAAWPYSPPARAGRALINA